MTDGTTRRSRWPAIAVAASAAIGVAMGVGAAAYGDGSEPAAVAASTTSEAAPAALAPAAAQGPSVPLGVASLAMEAQALQSELASYAVLAGSIGGHEESHAKTMQLQRHEEALAAIAAAASRLADGSPDAGGAQAIAVTAQAVRAGAVAAREGAHAETHGEEGAATLRAFAADVAAASARIQSLLAVLPTAESADAYEAALAEVVAEIERSEPPAPDVDDDVEHGHGAATGPADDPVATG